MQALYFAYGSNLFSARMRERVPSAQARGPARLAGHRLTVDKPGRDGTAKASGDVSILDKLAATMVTFTPDFAMIPGTTTPPQEGEWNPYEAGVETIRGE